MRRTLTALLAVAAAIGAAAPLTGCATTDVSSRADARLQVAAAENFWGSIAAQLGGEKVAVTSIIVNPDTDPHSYEPTAADAIALARSRLAIINGIGYDRWASRLLDADGSSGRTILNVGDLLGLKDGDNPHQWYSPASLQRVVSQIAEDYKRLDPGDAAYFDRRRQTFETKALAQYHRLLRTIRARYANVPVGYSESVFEPLGRALGLRLLTPYSFARAIAEGTDVSAADAAAVDSQVQHRRIKVWVYNSQNVTPDVQRVNALARAARIPITTITETLARASASYQQWQVTQLSNLLHALHQGAGR